MSIWTGALLIFCLRIVDVTLGTMRVLMVVQGRKGLVWLLGFCQALVFVTAVRQVLTDLGNWPNLLGYAAGFATGLVVGIRLDEWLGPGYGHVRIISARHGAELVELLRADGFSVVQFPGRGRDGTVDVLNCSLSRRRLKKLKALVSGADPAAFVTVQRVRLL